MEISQIKYPITHIISSLDEFILFLTIDFSTNNLTTLIKNDNICDNMLNDNMFDSQPIQIHSYIIQRCRVRSYRKIHYIGFEEFRVH